MSLPIRSVPSQASPLGGWSRLAGCSSNTSSGCVASSGAPTAAITRARISTTPTTAARSRSNGVKV